MDRGSMRCYEASRKNCKKKPKERCKGGTEGKKESQDNNKKYKDACEKRILKGRFKFLKEHITDKIKEGRVHQITQLAESISNNIDNGRKIWEVKHTVKKRMKPHTL